MPPVWYNTLFPTLIIIDLKLILFQKGLFAVDVSQEFLSVKLLDFLDDGGVCKQSTLYDILLLLL
jgi:hypothetical protein